MHVAQKCPISHSWISLIHMDIVREYMSFHLICIGCLHAHTYQNFPWFTLVHTCWSYVSYIWDLDPYWPIHDGHMFSIWPLLRVKANPCPWIPPCGLPKLFVWKRSSAEKLESVKSHPKTTLSLRKEAQVSFIISIWCISYPFVLA